MSDGGVPTRNRPRARSGAARSLHPPNRKRIKRKLREKTSSNQVARLGLLVSLLVAVLSPIVSVTTTLVGAYNSRHQSAEEFQRNQQQAAYADFIALANITEDAINQYDDILPAFNLDSSPPEDHDSRQRAATDSIRKMSSKIPLIRLVGSNATISAAEEVDDEAFSYYNDVDKLMIKWGTSRTTGFADTNTDKMTLDRMNMQEVLTYYRALEKFVAAARDDLDSHE